MKNDILIRLINANDSMEELTELLHRAYAAHAAAGMNFTAADQDADETRRRIAIGEPYVAELNHRIVGTIILRAPGVLTYGIPYFEKPGVAYFAQFAVDPDYQKHGIGSRLVEFVERRAAELKIPELALDTAEPAAELIAWYDRRGYKPVDITQWPGKTYRSVILSKKLA
ncbi:MAG: GNAT family N-acetyltransferase [Candidatus Sumerlaeia bacterium]